MPKYLEREGISRRPPAVDFIDNRLGKYHQAFLNPPVHFDMELQKYTLDITEETSSSHGDHLGSPRPPPSAVEAMKFWATFFPKAMDELNESSPKPKDIAKGIYSIRDSKNWEEVRDRLTTAREKYENQNTWVTRKFQQGFHKAGDRTVPVKRVLDVVKDVQNISPVVVALQIVLEAAKDASQIRKEIEGLEDELTSNFSTIESLWATFPGDVSISEASVQLVTATLGAIENVIEYYGKRKFVKAGGFIAKGNEYPHCLKANLSKMRSCSEKLLFEADLSHMWQNSQIYQKTMSKNDSNETLVYLMNTFKSFLEEYKENKREKDFLVFQNAQLNAELVRARTPSPLPNLQPVPAPLSQESIIELLGSQAITATDVEYVMNRRTSIPHKDRLKAEGVMKSHQFRDWIVSPMSQKLLIHGNYPVIWPISGLSVLCSMLYKALQTSTEFIPLIFFCGRHLDERDVIAGGRGLIKSLVSQTLSQYPIDTTTLNSYMIRDALNGNFHALCALFQSLADQLPKERTMVCIIDGIKYYERDMYEKDMGEALVQILNMVYNPNRNSVLKVLVTSPLETKIVRNAFYGCILSMSSVPTAVSTESLNIHRELGI